MLNYLIFKDINLECRDIKTIIKNDTSKNTDIDHIVNNGGCDKTCETIIGIALVLVGQVYIKIIIYFYLYQNLLVLHVTLVYLQREMFEKIWNPPIKGRGFGRFISSGIFVLKLSWNTFRNFWFPDPMLHVLADVLYQNTQKWIFRRIFIGAQWKV